MNVLPKTIKPLFLETRPHFLLLSVVLSCVGTSMVWYDGCFKLLFFILAFVGLLLIHTSRNVLNDRQLPHKPRLVGGVERPNGSRGTIKNEISFPGSPALWVGSFTISIIRAALIGRP
jgi:hypothetical protein